MAFESLGKLLVLIGVIFVAAGVLFVMLGKVPWVGRLPGDIIVRKEGFTLYFPIVTMILISIILTIILNLIGRK
ncbi:MAG: DUF2905 domain-containing protein [Candidatus Saganbacteria bacterium]|nr:DUF2905 domain-containing protein [Candidatus Saganbacteria bacterium]